MAVMNYSAKNGVSFRASSFGGFAAETKKKIWPKGFELVQSGKKRFEFRLADFKIREGDILILEEYNPRKKEYTGRKIRKKVKFFMKFNLDAFGQKKEIEKKGFYIIQF